MSFFGPAFRLVSEDGLNLSLGRISFWIAFGVSCYSWINFKPEDFHETLFYFLILAFIYNTCKKILFIIAPILAELFATKTKITKRRTVSRKVDDDDNDDDRNRRQRVSVDDGIDTDVDDYVPRGSLREIEETIEEKRAR